MQQPLNGRRQKAMHRLGVRRARPYRPTSFRPVLAQHLDRFEREVRGQRALEQQHILRGLMVLGLAVLGFGLWRAGLDRVFPTGWRLW